MKVKNAADESSMGGSETSSGSESEEQIVKEVVKMPGFGKFGTKSLSMQDSDNKESMIRMKQEQNTEYEVIEIKPNNNNNKIDDLDLNFYDNDASKEESKEETSKKEISLSSNVMLIQQKRRNYEQKKTYSLNENQLKKLQRWISFTRHGDVIEGTNIIPSKTFLMKPKWSNNLKPEDSYSMINFIKENEDLGRKIGVIIDINCSDNYYNFNVVRKIFRDYVKHIEYKKIKVRFDEIPHKSDLNKIYDILNKNIFKKHFTVVHCTHGVNRTGYAICYFLCKKFQIPVKEALERFEKARGYPIKLKEYIDDLYEKFEGRVCRESIVPTK